MKDKQWLNIGWASGAATILMMALLALLKPSTVSASGETFLVNSSSDHPDSNIGNCVCQGAGGCTLRAAIQEANACPGPQTIRFSAAYTITPATVLPVITDNGTVIDGSDQWFTGTYKTPGVVIYGDFRAFSGVVITASNCAVYGIAISSFGQHGIHLYGGAQNNTIGGQGHQRNVISHNGWNGVLIEGTTTTGNDVTNNYVGTDSTGRYGAGNGWHGISVWDGGGNQVMLNLVADNGWSGITMDAASSGTIAHNRIGMNVAGQPLSNGFYGVHIGHGATPWVSHNTIAFNRRGIHIEGGSAPWIYYNTIYGNNASSVAANPKRGGGIYCDDARPTIVSNVITNNVAYTAADALGFGGGLYLLTCDGVISGNTVVSNTANTAGEGWGGGIYLWGGDVVVSSNTIMSNTAGADVNSRGGGLMLSYNSNATVDGNVIAGNSASFGGGLQTENSAFFTVTNNIIARNSALWDGGGVRAWASIPSRGLLVNNTIAQNGGWPPTGVYLSQYCFLTLTNNIVVSHYIGIHASPGLTNSVAADYTLFYGNIKDTDGSLITSTHAITGRDPLFLDPAGGNYHLRAGSPAVDAGITVPWLTTDIDGDPRPLGARYDIGADEVRFIYLPLVLRQSP